MEPESKDYRGVIIEESLKNTDVLKDITIVSTAVEAVTEKHKTPWLNQWTLHTVEIPEAHAERVAGNISHAIDSEHSASWYADFKNDTEHFVIFRNKVFRIHRGRRGEYDAAVQFGLSLGIPEYQLDFSPDIQEWENGTTT